MDTNVNNAFTTVEGKLGHQLMTFRQLGRPHELLDTMLRTAYIAANQEDVDIRDRHERALEMCTEIFEYPVESLTEAKVKIAIHFGRKMDLKYGEV